MNNSRLSMEALRSDLYGEASQQARDNHSTAPFITFNRVTQQAINNHLVEIGALQTRIDDPGNTVLAIVKFPSDTDAGRACDGDKWRDMHLLMNYEKLMGLGSSRINAMFSPKTQARIRRTHGLTTLPPGVEYVLDFTPPAEGIELADLTATLWLPRMVKLWFLAGHFLPDPIVARGPVNYPSTSRALADKAAGACLALGHDDLCKNTCCVVDHASWEINQNTPGIFEGDGHIPWFRKVDDYCPVRHRVSIMRVLRAINGHDLLLNSATRMWTVAQMAIHLEVPQIVVDPVTQWLIAPPNTKFIEICPERAFQLAYALKIPDVLTTAFELLVSELAVDLAAPGPSTTRPACTWVGRRRDEYGDFPSDPVDYAARALLERITGYVEMLLSDAVFDKLSSTAIPEWVRLREVGKLVYSHGGPALKRSYNLLIEALPVVFHRKVKRARDDEFSTQSRLVPLIEAQRAHYIPEADRVPISDLYRKLHPAQRVLTPFFWQNLASQTDYNTCEFAFHNGRSIHSLNAEFDALLKAEVSQGNLRIPGYTTTQPPNQIMHVQSQQANTQQNQALVSWVATINFFHPQLFFSQLAAAVSSFSESVFAVLRETKIPLLLSDHLLLNLAEKELDFLPIWAGGLDDGTGGVFQEPVPEADMGPSEPGPGYHTGHTIATDTSTLDCTSTIAPSDLGMGNLDLESVTHARSFVAEQSVTTGPARGVVASINDSWDDRFSAFNDGEYADARFAQPAGHQAHGQALANYVEDDAESTVPSFTVDGDTVSEVGTEHHQQQPQQQITTAQNNDEFDMMDMEPEGEIDFSDGDSDSTLGESDYDMI